MSDDREKAARGEALGALTRHGYDRANMAGVLNVLDTLGWGPDAALLRGRATNTEALTDVVRLARMAWAKDGVGDIDGWITAALSAFLLAPTTEKEKKE